MARKREYLTIGPVNMVFSKIDRSDRAFFTITKVFFDHGHIKRLCQNNYIVGYST